VLSAVGRLGGSLGLAGAGYGHGGGVQRIQLEFAGHPAGNGIDHLFWSWLMLNVRIRGGGGVNSVQKALGQRWPKA